ncbi:hypothetical protein, partial [Dyella sp. 2YAF14]|uniref:hypothetical protein n=1 Tax=Dyella sp. 2YAF14 TaxID=3233025 RepID=UPI003F90973C
FFRGRAQVRSYKDAVRWRLRSVGLSGTGCPPTGEGPGLPSNDDRRQLHAIAVFLLNLERKTA